MVRIATGNGDFNNIYTPKGTTMAANTVTAIRDESFLDSFGVNIHLQSGVDGNAYSNVTNVLNDLAYLGITNVRDAIYPVGAGQATFDAAYTALAQAGIKFDLCVGSSNSDLTAAMAGINAFAKADPGAIKAVEGPNEINYFPFTYNGQTDQPAAIAFQTALYKAVHSDPLLAGVPVYDFTGGSTNEPISGLADYANIHPYPANGDQPDWYFGANNTADYGAANLGPEVATEAGYNSDTNATSGVSLDAQAKMTLNQLLDATQQGFSQIYLYELLDENADPNNTNSDQHWGLFNNDNSPKPVAVGIHNLEAILKDTAATATTFTPGVLPYTVTGLPWAGHTMLLEKSTGAFDIAVWNEQPIWDPSAGTEIAVAPTSVVVSLGSTFAKVEVFAPLQGAAPIQTLTNVSSVTLSLADQPLIIETEPAAPPKPTPSPNGTRITSAAAKPIIDQAGNAWTLVQSASTGLQIAVNGVVDGVTSNVVLLETLNGSIVQENTSGNWYSEPGKSGPWKQIAAPEIDITFGRHAKTAVVSGVTVGTTSAAGDTFVITAAGVAQVTLGGTAQTMTFTGLSSVAVTGGTGAATIGLDGGTNSFVAGTGALTITGGVGADAYTYHAGDALMTVKDFSLAKGDSLKVDKALQGSLAETSDGSGGVIVSFGANDPGVHLVGVSTIAAARIHFV
jgi:hypothetical protein